MNLTTKYQQRRRIRGLRRRTRFRYARENADSSGHSAEAENNGDFRLPGESWNNPWFWYGSSGIEIGYWLVINKREGLHTHSIREASALLILRQPFTVSLELLFADLASCVTALESFYRGIITPGRSVTSLQCPVEESTDQPQHSGAPPTNGSPPPQPLFRPFIIPGPDPIPGPIIPPSEYPSPSVLIHTLSRPVQ